MKHVYEGELRLLYLEEDGAEATVDGRCLACMLMDLFEAKEEKAFCFSRYACGPVRITVEQLDD